ncbi:hypothetical protein HYX58_03490 [Candidatus Dependentiae bacterium]|nr:hypothetical protein [Candidatus Dependentiae bacterium]
MKNFMLSVVFLSSSISIFANAERFTISASEIPDNKNKLLTMVNERIKNNDNYIVHSNNIRNIGQGLSDGAINPFLDVVNKKTARMLDYVDDVYKVHEGSLSDEIKAEVAEVANQNAYEFENFLLQIQAARDNVNQAKKDLLGIINESENSSSCK